MNIRKYEKTLQSSVDAMSSILGVEMQHLIVTILPGELVGCYTVLVGTLKYPRAFYFSILEDEVDDEYEIQYNHLVTLSAYVAGYATKREEER